MGGCATKPKVSKEEHHTPEPPATQDSPKSDQKVVLQPQGEGGDEAEPHDLLLHEIVDVVVDDQTNRRRSLSLLFKQNEDGKGCSESEEREVEERVREEAPESPVMGLNESNEGLKQHSHGANKDKSELEESEGDNINIKPPIQQDSSEAEFRNRDEPLQAPKSEDAFKAQIGP